jgi:hypothetical protein
VTLFFLLSVCAFVSDEEVCEIIKTLSGVVNLLPCLVQEPRLVSSRNVVTLSNYKSSLLRGVSGFFVFPLGFPVTRTLSALEPTYVSSGRPSGKA